MQMWLEKLPEIFSADLDLGRGLKAPWVATSVLPVSPDLALGLFCFQISNPSEGQSGKEFLKVKKVHQSN